jgi:type VI secretion system protein VasD
MTAHPPKKWRQPLAHAVAFGLLVSLLGCGGPPPPPPPTIAKLTLSATTNANATEAGQGAPTIVRVYQLDTTAGFDKAEFFRLLNGDAAVLGPDLVKREEYLLAPGTKKEETLTIPDRVHALGVFAGYREFQKQSWHTTIPVPPNKTTAFNIGITAMGIVVDKPAAP